ncbi:MAG: VOC family protein [Actinobacteria bacterium]|nr:VOC family protein [Actinomycetota bacterium]
MRPRLVGINHVALQVDDLERALDFYGRLFELHVSEREIGAAFVDMGDQFLALFEPGSGEERHFGLVVDDKGKVRRALEAGGVDIVPGRRLDFHDPFDNRVQVVQYDQIQFTKSCRVLEGMGLPLGKVERAIAELRSKNLA